METFRYHLHFRSPVHFGSVGIGLERTEQRLPSDSLASALTNAFAVMGEADEVVEALASASPPFCLSSLFLFGPSREGSGVCYSLPKPLIPPPLEDRSSLAEFGMELKRIRYLTPEDFFRWIGVIPLGKGEVEGVIQRNSELAGYLSPSESGGWCASELRPRVALDRESNNSSIWFCGALHFRAGAGLYGFVRVLNEKWKERLTTAFRLLGALGLGGERTYGMGAFDFSGFEGLEDRWRPRFSGGGRGHVLLSSYFPSAEERSDLANRFLAWDMSEVRGYAVSGRTATTLKRKRLRMITEGSVARQEVKGAMVDVTPEHAEAFGLRHRVYRCGLAFLVPEGGA
jgi:CRISPR-associated protein Csm4